jgi:hypothetical protein
MFKAFVEPSVNFTCFLRNFSIEMETLEWTNERLFAILNDFSRCLQFDLHRSEREIGRSSSNDSHKASQRNPLFIARKIKLITFIMSSTQKLTREALHAQLEYLVYAHIALQVDFVNVVMLLRNTGEGAGEVNFVECCRGTVDALEAFSTHVELITGSRSCLLKLMELICALTSYSEGLAIEDKVLSVIIRVLQLCMDKSCKEDICEKRHDFDRGSAVGKTFFVDDQVDVTAYAIVIGTLLRVWNSTLRRFLLCSTKQAKMAAASGSGELSILQELNSQCTYYATKAIKSLTLRGLLLLLSSNDAELLNALLHLAEIGLRSQHMMESSGDKRPRNEQQSDTTSDETSMHLQDRKLPTKRLKTDRLSNGDDISAVATLHLNVSSSPFPIMFSEYYGDDGNKSTLTAFIMFVADVMCFDANVFCDLLNSPETCALQYFLRATKVMMSTLMLPGKPDVGGAVDATKGAQEEAPNKHNNEESNQGSTTAVEILGDACKAICESVLADQRDTMSTHPGPRGPSMQRLPGAHEERQGAMTPSEELFKSKKCIVRLEKEVSYTVDDADAVRISDPRSLHTLYTIPTRNMRSIDSQRNAVDAALHPTLAISAKVEQSQESSSGGSVTNISGAAVERVHPDMWKQTNSDCADAAADADLDRYWLDWLVSNSDNDTEQAGSILTHRFITFLTDLEQLLGKLKFVFDSTMLQNRVRKLLVHLS